MFKKTRFYVGLTLLVQSFTFFAMFIMLFTKKRSVTGALLAIASAGGIIGTYLIYRQLSDSMSEQLKTAVEDLCDDSEEPAAEPEPEVVIPVDDTVDENEFRDS